MADGATPPRPIGPSERIDAIDVLRGLALLGVVAMNVVTDISRFDLRAVFIPQASCIADRQRRRNDPDAGRRFEGTCAVFAAVRRRPCHPVRAAGQERAPHVAARAPARRVAGVRAHPPLPDLERRYSHRICARWIHRPAVPVRSALAIGCRRAGVSRIVPCDAGLSAAGIVARHGRAGAGCR